MVLKGDKPLLSGVKGSSPSVLSVTSNIDQLSLSSSFMGGKGRHDPEIYNDNRNSQDHCLDETRVSPSLSVCGKTSMQLPSASKTPARPPGILQTSMQFHSTSRCHTQINCN